RGISLILIPTPGKPQVHPEKLAEGYGGSDVVLQNPSYPALLEQLQAAEATVFDPGQLLAERKATGEAQYLTADTHWTPSAMQAVAASLAQKIREVVELPGAEAGRYTRIARPVSNLGDI